MNSVLLTLLTLLLACKPAPDTVIEPPPPEPGELLVGVARVRMAVPLGIGTAGFGFLGADPNETPFSDLYPGTETIHNHPDFRAIAISRGEGFEVILLRSDTIGMFQQLRRAVVLELQDRTGRDYDHALVIGATHTHSGPGRVINMGGPFDFITDRFLPEHYQRLVDGMADAVELALADLRPGRVGIAQAQAPDGIEDRRCADGLIYENAALPLIAVEQEGEIVGLHMAYAIHGTLIGIDDLTLSQDVSGGIEQAVADRFDHPVVVQMFNSWGADMRPADPVVPSVPGAVQPADYDRMERVGFVVADAVEEALSTVQWETEPVIAMDTWRFPIDRDAIGYDASTFQFDYGAVYCDVGDVPCDGGNHIEGLDQACLPFTEEFSAPTQTEISAGRIGAMHFVTFPGEPGTLLAERVIDTIRSEHPEIEHFAFFGYSQDYLGYAILEDDWWNGGYEASGALWGPQQGEYLSRAAVSAFEQSFGDLAPTDEPAIITPFEVDVVAPYQPTTPIDVGSVLVDVPATAGPQDTIVFEIAGTDPWLGAPLARLELADGTPLTRAGGLPVDSDSLGFSVRLDPEPSYEDAPDASQRLFRWRFTFPVQHQQPTGLPELSGAYRFGVSIPLADGTLLHTATTPFDVSAL